MLVFAIGENMAFNTEVSLKAIAGMLTALAPLDACDHVEYYSRRERAHETHVMV